MLAGTATIEETVEMCFSNDIDMMIEKERKAAWKHVKWRNTQVEWAKNYVPRKSSAFDPSKVRR